MEETIAAPVTPPGQAAVAIIRVSGPGSRSLVEQFSEKARRILSSPRELIYTAILDRSSGDPCPLDYGLVAFFPGPGSFTGEDCAEFHLHGSPFIVRRLLENFIQRGVRVARPGEFTERAFLNGRIDLSQAEAVADLIAAETVAQARAAREQLEGKLSHAISELGDPLRELLAEVEACIDFPEEDIEPETHDRWLVRVEAVQAAVHRYLQTFAYGRLVREGAVVVLAGPPNVGKSSLLNRLLGEERAIVTPIPGTTRDTIEERISLDGLVVRLVDTAGIVDESTCAREIETVERLGVERSWQQLQTADLVLLVFDLSGRRWLSDEPLMKRALAIARRVIAVGNKCDLFEPAERKRLKAGAISADLPTPVLVSALTGEGIEELTKRIHESLVGNQSPAASVLISNQRHAEALDSAHRALSMASVEISNGVAPEIVSLRLREALGKLEEIIGVTTAEDILGRIFAKFCIGK